MRVTASIIDAYEWFIKCPPNWKQKAYGDLLDKLNRKKTPTPPACARGQAFESVVNALVLEPTFNPVFLEDTIGTVLPDHTENLFQQLYDELTGTTQQECMKASMNVMGVDFEFFGYADYIRHESRVIYDLKTTGAAVVNPGKYRSRVQHLIYMYATKYPVFKYVVAGFNEDVSLLPTSVTNVDIEMSAEVVEASLYQRLEEFYMFLQKSGLIEVFETVYNKGK